MSLADLVREALETPVPVLQGPCIGGLGFKELIARIDYDDIADYRCANQEYGKYNDPLYNEKQQDIIDEITTRRGAQWILDNCH